MASEGLLCLKQSVTVRNIFLPQPKISLLLKRTVVGRPTGKTIICQSY